MDIYGVMETGGGVACIIDVEKLFSLASRMHRSRARSWIRSVETFAELPNQSLSTTWIIGPSASSSSESFLRGMELTKRTLSAIFLITFLLIASEMTTAMVQNLKCEIKVGHCKSGSNCKALCRSFGYKSKTKCYKQRHYNNCHCKSRSCSMAPSFSLMMKMMVTFALSFFLL